MKAHERAGKGSSDEMWLQLNAVHAQLVYCQALGALACLWLIEVVPRWPEMTGR